MGEKGGVVPVDDSFEYQYTAQQIKKIRRKKGRNLWNGGEKQGNYFFPVTIDAINIHVMLHYM